MKSVRTEQIRRRAVALIKGVPRAMSRGLLCLSMTAFLIISIPAPPARAECSNCFAVALAHLATGMLETLMHIATRAAINLMMETHKQQFMVNTVFNQWILGDMQHLSNQITSAAMGQVFMIGGFLDAQEQLQRQMLFQELTARAHKDYHPSTQMCSFGTTAHGLGTSSRNAEMAAFALSQRSQDRQLHGANTVGGPGNDIDHNNRLTLFVERYCDAYDNNYEAGIGGGLTTFCSDAKPANNKWATNKDVDAGRLFNTSTVRARYDSGTAQPDDPDLFALANNLYASHITKPIPEALLSGNTPANITGNQDILLDVRSIVAKRSVAEDSFNQIAAMHTLDSDGGGAAQPFMSALLVAMGYSDDDASLSVANYPSYDARMELLTKKMYMEPEFYTNLYDKPANIARSAAAMRAIGLMQDMDLYKSHLRNEMSLSILLELEIDREQERVDNRLKELRSQK